MTDTAALEEEAKITDTFLDEAIAAYLLLFSGALSRMKRRIIKAVSDLAVDKDDNLRGPRGATRQVATVRREVAAAFATTFETAAKTVTDNYHRLLRHVVDQHKRLGIDATVTGFNREVLRALSAQSLRNYEALGLAAQERIGQLVYDTIVTRGDIGDLASGIEGIVSGGVDVRGRPLELYVAVYTTDSVMNVYRAMNLMKAEEAGIDTFLYVGGIIRNTRRFCRARDGNIYDRETINSWASMTWSGKSGHPMTHCGGYNCRHHWMPVPAVAE